jgi:CRP-like cAMP-binding protein
VHDVNVNVKPAKGIQEIRQIEGTLARLDLCAGVGGQTVRQLALQARMLRVPRGESLVRRGERPAGVFTVVRGCLKTRLQYANGDEVILSLVESGSTVGVAASVLEHPSKVDLIALEESLLLLIGVRALSAQMARDPRLARNVANHLATKAQALMAEFEHSKLPTLQRLAAYLNSLAEPSAAPQVWTARLPVSKTVVAARLGMKKETLSRLLQRLARRGVIRVARREITILDRARLAEASSDRARGASGRKAART